MVLRAGCCGWSRITARTIHVKGGTQTSMPEGRVNAPERMAAASYGVVTISAELPSAVTRAIGREEASTRGY